MRLYASLVALAVGASLVASAGGGGDGLARAEATQLSPVVTRRLENGMNVVVEEDHRVPLVSLSLRYDVGERASPPGLAGIAAVTAFLMLQESAHVGPGEATRLLTEAGATAIVDRTDADATTFGATLPSNRLELPLWLWSDAMGFFDGAVDEARVDRQRTALEGNFSARLDSGAVNRVTELVEEALYPEAHPYRNANVVAPEDVRRIDLASVLAFHRAWMTPDHATLAIVGDVEPRDAMALAARYFGTLPVSVQRSRIARPPPVKLAGETQIDLAANVPTARVSLRWPTARYLTVEDARLDIVADLLNGNRTAWVYWRLVDAKKWCAHVRVHQWSRDLGSELEVDLEGTPGHSASEILAGFDATMKEIESASLNQGMIERAVYQTLIDRLVDFDALTERARMFAKYNVLVGTPDYVQHDFSRYTGVSPEDVRQTIAQFMPADRRVVVLVTPDRATPVRGEVRARRFTPAGSP